jgi:hypothetical protein
MVRRVRWPLAGVLAAAVLAGGCRPAPPAGPAPSSSCGPNVPKNAQHPITSRPAGLAGDYDLIEVRTQPGTGVSSGRLHLTPLDSIARAGAVGGAVRDLIGWLEPITGDSSWRPEAGSRDPDHPGAVLAGDHLVLGQTGGFDGHVERLTITAVAPDGFWGWWKAEPGWEIAVDSVSRRVLPDPAGYFCALRQTHKR